MLARARLLGGSWWERLRALLPRRPEARRCAHCGRVLDEDLRRARPRPHEVCMGWVGGYCIGAEVVLG